MTKRTPTKIRECEYLQPISNEIVQNDDVPYCSLRHVRSQVHMQTHTQVMCAIYCMLGIIVFSLLLLLLLYISCKKLLIEGFFIENYGKEI